MNQEMDMLYAYSEAVLARQAEEASHVETTDELEVRLGRWIFGLHKGYAECICITWQRFYWEMLPEFRRTDKLLNNVLHAMGISFNFSWERVLNLAGIGIIGFDRIGIYFSKAGFYSSNEMLDGVFAAFGNAAEFAKRINQLDKRSHYVCVLAHGCMFGMNDIRKQVSGKSAKRRHAVEKVPAIPVKRNWYDV